MFSEYTDTIDQIELFPDGKIFRILFDDTVRKIKIICRRYDMLEELRNAFSAPNPSSFFMKQYGYKTEAKIYQINKFGYFSPGLLFEVLSWIKQNYSDISCIAMSNNFKKYILDHLTPLKKPLSLISDLKISNVAEDLGRNNELMRLGKNPFEFRDYQKASIEFLLTKGYGKGLIEVPTAGGKSFILANFIWNIHKNVDKNYRYLILVPNKQLVMQFYTDLIDYGFDRSKVTRFTAGLKKNEQFDPSSQIIIANRQYIFTNRDKLPKIDVLICDEVHQCLAPASQEFIEQLNCRIKIGCSGTLPRDKYQRWSLVGLFGRIVYTEDITALQDKGYISKLRITLLKVIDSEIEKDRKCLFHTKSLVKYRPDEFGYSEIEFNAAVNAETEYFQQHYKDLYKPIFEHLFKYSSNTLILFDRIEIGKNLFEYSKELYAGKKNVFYIDGSIDVNIREDVRSKFEASDGNLLIA